LKKKRLGWSEHPSVEKIQKATTHKDTGMGGHEKSEGGWRLNWLHSKGRNLRRIEARLPKRWGGYPALRNLVKRDLSDLKQEAENGGGRFP